MDKYIYNINSQQKQQKITIPVPRTSLVISTSTLHAGDNTGVNHYSGIRWSGRCDT
jgi:hypothetical protein